MCVRETIAIVGAMQDHVKFPWLQNRNKRDKEMGPKALAFIQEQDTSDGFGCEM